MLRFCLFAVVLAGAGCKRKQSAEPPAPPAASAAGSALAAAPISSLVVSHGELDTRAPNNAPKLAATVIAATVYKLPNVESRKLGYLRLGAVVQRDPDPVQGTGCKGQWYRIYPMGHVCSDEATTDLELPLVRATQKRP